MKKRTKITLRTKIYLTIVGLLALTGVFYAANPAPFASNQQLASKYYPILALNVAPGGQPGGFQPLQVDANFSWVGGTCRYGIIPVTGALRGVRQAPAIPPSSTAHS